MKTAEIPADMKSHMQKTIFGFASKEAKPNIASPNTGNQHPSKKTERTKINQTPRNIL
ncbi:hypothetical protein [Alistipes ihumii]|uniref:Uncharacterized protein n=1 Tax=Alistipes ihumii AP11 TaxID=1211813 RepID=A0ABY5UXK2_9BACT|nr:hypothetical protein [Alistipes ihumii]UWN56711.1 hypothetical protein NQ491_08635 [Alistipes ihumii AP11]